MTVSSTDSPSIPINNRHPQRLKSIRVNQNPHACFSFVCTRWIREIALHLPLHRTDKKKPRYLFNSVVFNAYKGLTGGWGGIEKSTPDRSNPWPRYRPPSRGTPGVHQTGHCLEGGRGFEHRPSDQAAALCRDHAALRITRIRCAHHNLLVNRPDGGCTRGEQAWSPPCGHSGPCHQAASNTC